MESVVQGFNWGDCLVYTGEEKFRVVCTAAFAVGHIGG